MSNKGFLSWGNIEIEFITGDYDIVDIQSAIQDVEKQFPSFASRVPDGTVIILGRHHYSGEFVGAYQIGRGAPAEVSVRAQTSKKAARHILNDIASKVLSEISILRHRSTQ